MKGKTTDALSLSRKFINRVLQEGVNLDHAYLFGSFARGKTWEGSDIDICLVSPDFQRDEESKRHSILRVAVTLDPRLEPILYTPQEFANKYDAGRGGEAIRHFAALTFANASR